MKYYPQGSENILDSFKKEFESCFILLHPFFKIESEKTDQETNRSSSSKKDNSSENLKHFFGDITIPKNAVIYESNPNYPTESEIINNGIAISWNQFLMFSDQLKSYSDIQKGLKTSIGAYGKIFRRKDLMNRISKILETQKIWPPKEDVINAITKRKLFEIFNYLSLPNIKDLDFSAGQNSIDISQMNILQFCQSFSSSVIHSEDMELMVSQDRDTFFCLLFTKKRKTMDKILNQFNLEGILCDSQTCLPWEFKNDEFKSLLEQQKIKNSAKRKTNKRNWLNRIFKR